MTNSPIFGSISFNYFTDASQHKHYDLKTVKWRSMQGVDLAIIELENVSLQQLINDGIEPLKLATRTPDRDSDVLVVGAPQYRSLQMSACTLQPASDVIEGQWVWRNNFMTRCQGIEPGSSGSPLLDRSTNEIIGVVGTGNFDDLRTPCIINNPCILKHGRYTAVRNNVYGNPTAFLQGCFKEGVMVEDDASACQLYPTFNVTSQQPPTSIKLKRGKDKKVIAPDWDYQFTIDTTFYRHKTVSVASECENPLHYGSVEPSANAHINNQIHWQNGRAFLCIVGVESEQQPLDTGLMRNALSLPVNLLN
jgi:hypothetical protein